MKKLNKGQKNMLIGGLCALVLVMAVGYAAFATNLNITSSAQTTTNWDIEIISITANKTATNTGTEANPVYASAGSISQSYTDLTATFSAALVQPGDSVVYDIVVENKGNIDAALNNIKMNTDHNAAISITKSGISVGDVLEKEHTATLHVTVTYNSNVEGQPAKLTSAVTLTLEYVQYAENMDYGTDTLRDTTTIGGQLVDVVTTGDGLYDNGDSTYTYKGANPDNYLSFAGNTWRILGIDSQGIKIITDEAIDLTGYSGVNESVSTNGSFDSQGLRDSTSNGAGGTYCSQSSDGCNAWAATSNLVGQPAEFVNGEYHGTVLLDSELNTYLNGTYYTNTLNSNSNIIRGTYNVGNQNNESQYQWQGHVALLTGSEYTAAGGLSSYLKKSYPWWLLSPSSANADSVRRVNNRGINTYSAAFTPAVRPVLYLNKNITLTGTGTNDANIYTIVE